MFASAKNYVCLPIREQSRWNDKARVESRDKISCESRAFPSDSSATLFRDDTDRVISEALAFRSHCRLSHHPNCGSV